MDQTLDKIISDAMKRATEKLVAAGTKTLADAAPQVAVAQIVNHGEQLTLPEGMSIPQAIDLLKRREKYEQEEMSLRASFDVFPWDGAHALDAVLIRKFGWSPAEATPGFFGPNPPELIEIEVGPGRTKSVPWGAFSLPGVEGLLHTDTDRKGGRVVFSLFAQVKRKDEPVIKSIFDEVRAELKKNSIYRGKAIKIRFYDDDGDKLNMPEPKFMDTDSISEGMLVYPDEVMRSIETNLFTPIRRVNELKANGIPVKRGVMLGGMYGTGKTLAATVASKLAVEAGVTYLYVPHADELAEAIDFAKQYQEPACVIFCEDIDRAVEGDERTVEMDDILNIIDGIDTKNSNIIVVLTTNHLESINPAMLRPGRLDAVIDVLPPDAHAVERLLRLYGGDAIDATTDLSAAAKVLDGRIPAVIAEVVKRAKLAQLRLQQPGQIVTKISEAALLEAAETMQAHLKLLDDRINSRAPERPTLEAAMHEVVQGALNGSREKIAEIHERTEQINNRVQRLR